jgi:energy-coupling factor transporter ATP-binding protein EcfA2
MSKVTSRPPSHATLQTKAQPPRKAGEPPVELASLEVKGLFGRFDHRIDFPHALEAAGDPSLVILNGPNGIGKTTLLLMLDGLLRADFDIFRVRPFTSSTLTLSSGDALTVERTGADSPLFVSFRKHRAELHPRNKGPLRVEDTPRVEAFRDDFFEATADIQFELITTARTTLREDRSDSYRAQYELWAATRQEEDTPETRLRGRLRPSRQDGDTLALQVRRFVTEAQVNYRQFFRTEPDLFARIFEVIQGDEPSPYDPADLAKRADKIAELDKLHSRLGLQPDYWNRDELVSFLRKAGGTHARPWALAALGAYLEGLESRAQERQLLAERLVTFERIINRFFAGKRVRIGGREGLRIEIDSKTSLSEAQLSSGEYHLLYLLVASLVARRRGTVIAIDEPEMSMHVSWQRRLIKSLVEVASHARPQLLLATHSPDVVASYREFMVPLGH